MEEIDPSELQSARKRISKCMFNMFRDFPFWAFLIEKCNVKLTNDTDKVPTACIDRHGNIYFSKYFFDSLCDREVHFVLAHEVMHLLLDHHNRRGGREPLIWNIAGDVLINEMLQDHFSSSTGSVACMSDYLTCESLNISIDPNSVTTEEVYDKLTQEAEENVKMKCNKAGANGSSNDIVDWGPGEEPNSNNIRDKSEDTPTNGKEWAEAGLEAATRSKMAGNCPKFMERRIDQLLNAEVPWHEVLAYYLRQKFCMNNRSRHTFTPPNRRYLHQDLILTARKGSKTPSVAFSVDTSGSMSSQDITKGISEMDAIRKMYKVPIYLMEADSDVHKARWIQHHEPIPTATGGGGTSFVPVMEHLKNNNLDVDVLIYFTDGYGEFGADPGFDVIWVINTNVKAPYGKTIKVSN